MAVNFPTSLDDFTNPISSNALNNPSHSEQHQNINDAVEALEAKVGVNGSAVTTSHDYKIAQLESGKQDALGFTPENVVNKRTSFQATPTDTAYPSEKLVKESLDEKIGSVVEDTTPQLGGQLDVNGQALGDGTLELLKFEETASAVNEITIKNAATGSAPEVKATGDDTNIDVKLTPKGAGKVAIGTAYKFPSADGTSGQVIQTNGAGVLSFETPSGGGASLWTTITGTRASNTTITVATDKTAIFKKGMIVRWQESGVDKVGMVSIPSTYSSPNTTITIIGDTCASIDTGTFKYSVILGAEPYIAKFAYAGTVGAVATNVMNAYYATEPMRVIGADLQVGTAGTTNSTTIDINKGGTTMFTTKPTLATTVASSPTPFTADTATSLALGDKVTVDVDAVQTTAAIDLYVQLYLFPSRFLTLS